MLDALAAPATDDEPRYRVRVIDAEVQRLLAAFGGVLIEGPKWCGKTWTGRHHARSAIYVDDDTTRQRAVLTPRAVLTGATPMLVDEWQDVPGLWDTARRIIDEQSEPGQFIFTGSAVPLRQATSHTGTGRFARLRMRPMSLVESGESSGAVSVARLMKGETIDPTASRLDYSETVRLICRGGWPASVGRPDDQALLLPRQYLRSVAESDLTRADGIGRKPSRVMAVLRSLARNTSTTASSTVLMNDLHALEGPVSMPTLRSYAAALDRIFVVEDLPAWRYSLRSKTQLLLSSKHHFADPSLAVAALNASPAALLNDPMTTGFLFESLCVRDLRIYAQANQADVFHYRDKKDLEADVIVQGMDGVWGAVEVKLGHQQTDAAAATLLRLKDKLSAEVQAPAFLMVLVATGGVAYTRADGVHVVPLDCLGV